MRALMLWYFQVQSLLCAWLLLASATCCGVFAALALYEHQRQIVNLLREMLS